MVKSEKEYGKALAISFVSDYDKLKSVSHLKLIASPHSERSKVEKMIGT